MSANKTKRLPPPADANKDAPLSLPTPAADIPPEKSIIEKPDATENSPGHCFTIQSQNDFETIVQKATKPVIVDFFATWCDPCKTLTPRLESVIQGMKGKVQLAKVDIDVMTELALDYHISSVPVLVRMKDGREQARMVGLQDVAELEAFIEKQEDTKSATAEAHVIKVKEDKPQPQCEVVAPPAQAQAQS